MAFAFVFLMSLQAILFANGFEFSRECENMVSKEDISSYEENGYLFIPNLLNQNELTKVQNSYQRLFDHRLSEGDELMGTWKVNWNKSINHTKLYSIHDIEFYDNIFSKLLLFHSTIGCYLEIGTKSSNVLLHHTKAHTKPSQNGAAFPPHQDYQYFPYEKDSMVAIFVHLDDTNVENGGLIIWPESHKEGPQFDQGWSDGTGYHYLNTTKYPFESGQNVIAKAGDAVMFNYMTVHASHPNKSDRDRRMILIQAVAAADKPLSMIHRHSKGQGLVLRGINPNQRQSSHYKRHENEVDIIEQEQQKNEVQVVEREQKDEL